MTPRRRKPASSKARKVGRVTPCAPPPANQRVRAKRNGARGATRPTTLREEFRNWRASLPTPLERDTLLWPEVIAQSVVREAERFLGVELPEGYAGRLAAKAHHLYPRHKQFHKMLNRPGNKGRNNLYVYMRHWVAGWLKQQRSPLFKRLPWSYSLGHPLPK